MNHNTTTADVERLMKPIEKAYAFDKNKFLEPWMMPEVIYHGKSIGKVKRSYQH